jgi:hypothetical protein
MKKLLKRWGNNLVIVFTKEEEQTFGMVPGDPIDIDDDLFLKQKVKEEDN